MNNMNRYTGPILQRNRLSELIRQKREFDPSVREDRILAYKFLESYSWRGITPDNLCPFFCEWPHVEVPAMLKDRLVDYYKSKEKF